MIGPQGEGYRKGRSAVCIASYASHDGVLAAVWNLLRSKICLWCRFRLPASSLLHGGFWIFIRLALPLLWQQLSQSSAPFLPINALTCGRAAMLLTRAVPLGRLIRLRHIPYIRGFGVEACMTQCHQDLQRCVNFHPVNSSFYVAMNKYVYMFDSSLPPQLMTSSFSYLTG